MAAAWRRCASLAAATLFVLLAGGVSAPLATGADTSPCGAEEQVPWWSGPVQQCPLAGPLAPDDRTPVYSAPVAHAKSAPVPAPAGWLYGTAGQRFVCQQLYSGAVYYHPAGYRNVWWAYTKSDTGVFGWVPEVFFRGGLDDEPDSGLRRCPQAATPVPTPQEPRPPPPTPQPGEPVDGDRDGAPDGEDACPTENARPRDADLNGCLDLLRLRPEFKLTPGVFVRLVGGRYKKLGITLRRLTVTGLPAAARIVLTCSRSACPRQSATAKAGRRVEFKRMRGKKLRTGVRLTLRASLAGHVGAGSTYTILPNDTRKREYCIRPDSTRRGSCSTKR